MAKPEWLPQTSVCEHFFYQPGSRDGSTPSLWPSRLAQESPGPARPVSFGPQTSVPSPTNSQNDSGGDEWLLRTEIPLVWLSFCHTWFPFDESYRTPWRLKRNFICSLFTRKSEIWFGTQSLLVRRSLWHLSPAGWGSWRRVEKTPGREGRWWATTTVRKDPGGKVTPARSSPGTGEAQLLIKSPQSLEGHRHHIYSIANTDC